MFWESVETIKERTLQQMVKESSTSLDDILNHDYCFQELRVESPYLVEYFTRTDVLNELLNRSLFFRPSPDVKPLLQYKVCPRALGILTLGCKPVNNALLSNSELVERLIKYLEPSENSYVNDITAGFYKRLVIAMLITFETPENKFLDALEKSNFMDYCFKSMEYGAIAELIVRVPSHCTNTDFQKRIFDWYANVNVARRILDLYNTNASVYVLENAGFMWSEFNEMQLRQVETAESFTKSLYSVEIVKGLSEIAFSSVENSSPMLINYIAPILVSFIEMNRAANEPGFKAFPDLYMREPILDLGDPEFTFQSEIVRHSNVIMKVILKAFDSPISAGHTLTAVSCLRIIRALTNSSHEETHATLAKVLVDDDTSIVKLYDYAARNPSSSICNNQIMAIVAHIMFSTTKEHLLIDALFKTKPTITAYILGLLEKHEKRAEGEPYLEFMARKSFFLKIGEFIKHCPYGLRALGIKQFTEQEEAEKWQDLTMSTVCENLLEIDEVAAVTDKSGETSADLDIGEISPEKNMQSLAI
ncbi:hypothetical protein M3Y97_00147100 [Aphelenchoides bicaudatus]|nr:hypothetical protein M3Y97_00147100 [Aphelenchoides bicaudatus]